MGHLTRANQAARPRAPLRWCAPRAWRALLAPRDPRAALLVLVPGDPLELRLLVAERLAARALVVDAALVVARAAARVAAALRAGAARSGASAGLRIGPAWLVALVDEALVADDPAPAAILVCPSRSRASDGVPPAVARALGDAPTSGAAGGRALGYGRRGARLATPRRCAVELLVERTFRRRALVERRALLAVLLERGALERVAQSAQVDVGTLARRVRSALAALARAVAPAPPCRCYGELPADSDADGVFLASLPRELVEDARRALAALRVLHATRRGPHSSFEVPHVERELAALERARLGGALRALLARALNRALPADSYLDYTTRESGAEDALSVWHALGAVYGARASPSDPFAPPRVAAERLLAALSALHEGRDDGPLLPLELALWRVRLEHAAAPPRELAAACIDVARRAAEARDLRVAAAAARDGIAALLDAGAPEAALEAAHALGAESEPLVALSRAALAEPRSADGSRPSADRGPRSVSPPRGRRVPTRRDTVARGANVRARAPRSASAFGATVLVVVRWANALAEVVHLDVAPGCAVVGVPALRAQAVPESRSSLALGSTVERAEACGSSACGPDVVALDPAARSILVRWIRDVGGVSRGWVQLELRHGLLLDPRCLDALAADWELAITCVSPVAPRAGGGTARPASPRVAPRGDAGEMDGGPVFSAARELIARLGVGTAQRRWSLFVADVPIGREAHDGSARGWRSLPCIAGDPATEERARAASPIRAGGSIGASAHGARSWACLARGGGAHLGHRDPRASGALQRALVSDEPVDIGVDPGRLAVHVAAQSGTVVGVSSPLGARYVLALESPRREQSAPSDASHWQRVLAAEALRIDLARRSAACAMHAEEGTFALPSDAPDALDLARQVAAAACSSRAIALVGPPGSGRRALACWLHVEARRPGRVVQVVAPFAPGERTGPDAAWGGATAGDTAVLIGIERVDGLVQLALAARLAAPVAGGADLAVVLPAAPRALVERGQLVPELAARLCAWTLVAPALGAVRHRIPALSTALLERVARRRGAASRELVDGALALLWRGTWPCNILDLAAVAERLGGRDRAPEPGPCTAAEVARAMASIGLEPVARLPSRLPRAIDVAGALWCTRTAGGRINKTRAAAWLGWDAETLAARLVDLGLSDLDAVARTLAGGPKEEGPIRVTRDGSLDLP